MNCGQFETRLNLILDQRRSPVDDAALTAHATACVQCDDLLADHVALMRGVSEARQPVVRDGFARRVVEQARPVSARQRRAKRLLLAVCVAFSSAAAMLLAISIVWKAREGQGVNDPRLVRSRTMNSADFLVGAPSLWSNEVAIAAGGAGVGLDQVEKVAPGIRPWRESLTQIWEALRHAFQNRHDPAGPPGEEHTGQWAIVGLSIA